MLSDNIRLTLLQLLPRKTISRMFGYFARSSLSRLWINRFVSHYRIEMSETKLGPSEYQNLTELFIRELRPGAREVDQCENIIVSPVDGVVSEIETIRRGMLIQAKGMEYSVLELLGQDRDIAEKFYEGTALTIYLSPRDYHRIHAPLDAKIIASTYVPGTLFPVNPFGVRAVKGLFTKNERLVTYLDTKFGFVAIVKVGAIIVGSVKVNYDSEAATNIRLNKPVKKNYSDGFVLTKGQEVGRFEFGSTVIMLCQAGIKPLINPGDKVLMGQALGEINLNIQN